MPRAYRLLQFSDIHLLAEGRLRADIDALGNLEAAFATVSASVTRPDAIIVTGDLADRGEPEAYKALYERTVELARTLQAEVVFVPGNHDERGAFRELLLGEDGGVGDGPIDQVAWIGGLRVVALDTLVPGEVGGALRPEQLDLLRRELDERAPDGTILALHHPPIATPIRDMAAMALAEPDRLAEVVDGTDVMLVVAGHNHHASAGMLGGVPVWSAPATSYRSNPMNEDAYEPLPGCAYSRIDVSGGRAVVSLVPVDIPPAVPDRTRRTPVSAEDR